MRALSPASELQGGEIVEAGFLIDWPTEGRDQLAGCEGFLCDQLRLAVV